MSILRKRIFTIDPGLPFLSTLAESLMSGKLIPGFAYDANQPQLLASATIYVPTRRAARVLRSEFTNLCGLRSVILPVIRPLGETDDDLGFFENDLPDSQDVLEPIGATPAIMELARLILAWRNQLPQAITSVHDGQQLIAPASSADAVWLAKGLLSLINEVETAELDWSGLDNIEANDHAIWWQLTLEFLKIARIYWPARLEELGRSSPVKHRNALLEAEAPRLSRKRHDGPVIVAGSTGSLPATSKLIDAVAELENGAVVLPGLDLVMPDNHWDMLGEATIDGQADPAIYSHPQFGLAHLLRRLKVKRNDVERIATAPSILKTRQEVLSAALAPSRATGNWPEQRLAFQADEVEKAFSQTAIIEAANEREEATAIAVALRLALEEDGSKGESQVALITPDRTLARRVAGELARFNIDADDSAGTPFYATPQGSLLRLVLEATLFPGDPVVLTTLLKHPLARFGMTAKQARRAASLLEIHALRGGTGNCDISNLGSLLEKQLSQSRDAGHAPAWRPQPKPEELELLRDYVKQISLATEPLVGALIGEDGSGHPSAVLPANEWAQRTGQALEAVAIDEAGSLQSLWDGEAGDQLSRLLAGVIEAEDGLRLSGPDWAGVIQALAAGQTVKPRAMRHPRVFIFGTMESRLQHVDTVVLGGLNEGVWPGKTENSPFLSRSMKMAFGLEPPERRTGQMAHDFEMANGIPKVIYSRSLRQDGAPSVASRFLQRLQAVCGEDITVEMRERGERYRRYAQMMDEGERQPTATRPEPRPGVDVIPGRYSFSEVGKLRRDPYSVYARRILRLDPVEPFNADPGVAQRGTLYHAVFDKFIREKHDPASQNAWNAMEEIIEWEFANAALPVHVEAVWRPRFVETAKAFLDWERRRRPQITESFTEARALMELPDNLQLSGFADRIDITSTGGADIIDYKTGSTPSTKQARSLLDPQLALEAAALTAGAFQSLDARHVENLSYVRLRPGGRFKIETVNNDGRKTRGDEEVKTAAELGEEALAEFTKLVLLLRSGRRGFISRLTPESLGNYGEYDHLARVAEWSTSEDGGEEDGDDA